MPEEAKRKDFQVKFYHVILVRFVWVILLIAFFAALGADYFFFVKPNLELAKDGGPLDVEFHQQLLQREEAYLQKLSNLKAAKDSIAQVNLDKLDQILAPGFSVPALFRFFHTLEQMARLEMNSFSYLPPDEGKQGVVLVQLHFEKASYEEFKQLLKIIEDNIRIMDIIDLELKGAGEGIGLTIQTYISE